MAETNDYRVIGLFGLIGSGKSSLNKSLESNPHYNPIFKEETGFEWYTQMSGDSDHHSYECEIHRRFSEDPLFLMKLCARKLVPGRINTIDSVNTPVEMNFLRGYDSKIVGIWRNQEARKEKILGGRRKLIRSSEPTTEEEFHRLDDRVLKYMNEGGNLFQDADHIIVNDGEFDQLNSSFRDYANRQW
mgnify:CR=1 FL=1